MTYATVAPFARLSPLADELTYAIGPDQLISVVVGQLVIVPVRGRKVAGIITGLSRRLPIGITRVLPIQSLSPITLPASLIRLARWGKEWSWQSLGICLAAMLPPPLRRWSAVPSLTTEVETTKTHARPMTVAVVGSFEDRINRYDELLDRNLTAGRSGLIVFAHDQDLKRFTKLSRHSVQRWRSSGAKQLRWQQWQDLRSTSAPLVIAGLRSAIFAPLPQLGLIIVDTVDGRGHKDDQAPYYHVRRVAAARRQLDEAHLVFGGAVAPMTIQPLRTVSGPPLPTSIELIASDPANPAILQAGAEGWLTAAPTSRTFILLNQTGQGIRRCQQCGTTVPCPTCQSIPVEHSGVLKCLTCGWHGATPSHCTHCGGVTLALRGIGTETLAAKLERQLTTAVGLLDRNHPELPTNAPVVVGTSFALPYLHRFNPDRALILGLDLLRQRATFDAGERAIRLVAELATMVPNLAIATNAPNDPWLQMLAHGDFDALIAQELADRTAFAYPPDVTIATLRSATAEPLTTLSRSLGPLTVFGPTKRRNQRGYQLVVKFPHSRSPARWLKPRAETGLLKNITVEVDPSTDTLD